MKLIEIATGYRSLHRLMSRDLPGLVAYRLSCLSERYDFHNLVYTTQHNALLQRYGTPDAAQKTYTMLNDNVIKYTVEKEELDSAEVDEVFPKVTITLSDDFKITADEIRDLAPFIDFKIPEDMED